MKQRALPLLAAITLAGSPLEAEIFGGIEFPQGAVSFADEVVSYDPAFSGGAVPTHPDFVDPQQSLGVPDYAGGNFATGSVSLGSGGRLVVKFTNNRLTGSNDSQPDLHIFEVGSDVEDTFVEISVDGETWHDVGKVFGATSSVDIDAYGFTAADEFLFVRLTDDPSEGGASGETVGADIDAVGAISATAFQDAPDLEIETAILVKFQSALGSTYVIQQSLDLETWEDAVVGIQGDGSVLKYFFEITTPRLYYRLKPPAGE